MVLEMATSGVRQREQRKKSAKHSSQQLEGKSQTPSSTQLWKFEGLEGFQFREK